MKVRRQSLSGGEGDLVDGVAARRHRLNELSLTGHEV